MNIESFYKDRYFKYVLLFSIIIAFAFIYVNSLSNILGGIYVDPYFYLIQSLRYAGYSIGGYSYIDSYPPVVAFLTSLLFRLGFVNESSIFLVTGIFYIPAVIGVYALSRLRFNENISCIGSIFYGSLAVNLMWLGNGTIDIPSVAFSIWALYTFILAIEKNQRYFYLAIPLAVLSALTKYIGGLILVVMIMYLLSKKDIFRNIAKYIKHFIGGILLSFIFVIPFLANYYINNIKLGFMSQVVGVANAVSTATAYNDLYFYLFNIPKFVCYYVPIVGILVLIVLIVLAIYVIYKLIKVFSKSYNSIDDKIDLSFFSRISLSKNIFYGGLVLGIILFIASFFMAKSNSYMLCESIFFIGFLIFTISFNSIVYNLPIDSFDYKFFNYDITIFCWFFIYLIFFSTHLIKVNRYFIIHAPSFAIIFMFGLNMILTYLRIYSNSIGNYNQSDSSSNSNIHFNKSNNSFNSIDYNGSNNSISKIKFKLGLWNDKYNLVKVISILILVICLIFSLGYLAYDRHDSLVDDEKALSSVLNSPEFENITFASDRGPIYTWYLKKYVVYDSYSVPLNNLSSFLNENNASYYITFKNYDIPNLILVKNVGRVNVYKILN